MSLDLIPRSFFNIPGRLPSFLDEEDWSSFLPSSGLTVSEDDKQFIVEAAIPGVDPNQVEVTFDKGVLWVKGQTEAAEEDKQKKFYRKASGNFSYRVAIPNNIDTNQEPKATAKNGIMKVSFTKMEEPQPRKIQITQE